MISIYDEYYNKRERPGHQKFADTRSWDPKTMKWAPEKIDYPLQGMPKMQALSPTKTKKSYRILEDVAQDVHPRSW